MMAAGAYCAGTFLPTVGFEMGQLPVDFRVYIDGDNKAPQVGKPGILRATSPSIDDELDARNTCDVALRDATDSVEISLGDSVIVMDGGIRLFAGTVDNIDDVYPEMDLAGTEHFIGLKCVDYNQIADRHEVAGAYETDGQTAADVVRDILENYLALDGVTEGVIQTGLEIGKIKFPYTPVSKALDELATLVGYNWNIDENRRLNFFDRTTYAAPWEITDASPNFASLRRIRTREQYRNVQRVRGGQHTADATRTQEFKGDGKQRTFTLDLPIAKEPTVEVDAAGKTVGIQEKETGKDWYYQIGSKTITQDRDATILTSGNTLSVEYYASFPVLAEVSDDVAISDRVLAEGGSGRYEATEDDERIDSQKLGSGTDVLQMALQRAESLLREFARIPIVAEITTYRAGLRAGMLQRISLTREKLDGNYLIVQVSHVDRGNGKWAYRYKVIDGSRFESPYKFFQKLALSGRKFVIRENEVILLTGKLLHRVGVDETLTVDQSDTLGAWDTADPYTVLNIGETLVGDVFTEPAAIEYATGADIKDGTYLT
jgi:hypothetical protein